MVDCCIKVDTSGWVGLLILVVFRSGQGVYEHRAIQKLLTHDVYHVVFSSCVASGWA